MTQNLTHEKFDVVVIGGGFYGCSIALFLSEYFDRILVVEGEEDLLLRASMVNQARVHNGYHYPRSYLTALRSYINFPRFVFDFQDCIDSQFEKIYAIARTNSKVNAFQFSKTFSSIGAPISKSPKDIQGLFNSRLIEEVFTVKEFAFDAVKLRCMLKKQLADSQVQVTYKTNVTKLEQLNGGAISLHLSGHNLIHADKVFNCTYAGINELLGASGIELLPMKYELAEIALIEPPQVLKSLGITLMDGAYFSTMPFPSRNLHSLTHVRYTPHHTWFYTDDGIKKPYAVPSAPDSKAIFMLRDAERYLPIIKESKYIESLYEIKTILLQNEVDDGRPILLRTNYGMKNHTIIMGGKIDNIYDIFRKLTDSVIAPKSARAVAV